MAFVLPSATFLHIPKCGGSWVVQALAAAGLPVQEKPKGSRHAIAETEGRFVFTFVRHPLTWYPSFWNFRWQEAESRGQSLSEGLPEVSRRADVALDACLVDEHGRPRSFADFMEQCVTHHAGWLSHQFALYASKAHFIGRQESLCDDLLAALRRMEVAFDADGIRRLPKVNEANSKYCAAYPHRLAERLLAAEWAAIEAFYDSAPTPPARPLPPIYQERQGRSLATRS